MSADPMRLADCLRLLADGPVDMPVTHKAVLYLLHHKSTHAIVSDHVRPEEPVFQALGRGVRVPAGYAPAVRRWRLLDGYGQDELRAARCHGLAAARFIRDFVPKAAWPGEVRGIADPVARDAAGDVLRGWCAA